MNNCPNCGTPNTGNESYCAVCGRSLSASETPLVVLVKRPLALKRKLAILSMLFLLASSILSFVPISYTSAYHYFGTRSYISERSLIDSSNTFIYFSLLTSLGTIALLFLVSIGKKAPQKAIFWTTFASLFFCGIACAMILSVHDSFTEGFHDQDGMWGMILILGLQAVSVVLTGVIQFKRET